MQSVAVYCGSSKGRHEAYSQASAELGKYLADSEIAMVYGGGGIGLMGITADAVMKNGGRVHGFIPELLNTVEIMNNEITDLCVVKDMHERKAKMASMVDGAIVLPGGFGTLDEAFEFLTWSQIGHHNKEYKPCGFLNTLEFYRLIFAHVDHAIEEGFIAPECRELIIVGDTPAELIQAMRDWTPKYKPLFAARA